MSLLELPAETLIQIFDYVGSSYFRSDLSRLTVCKQWSRFALAVCFQDFYVTQKTLKRLSQSSYVETSVNLVKSSVRVLDLDLQGFQDWDSARPFERELRAMNEISDWQSSHGRAVRAAWTAELDDHLFYLATMMTQSRKLRILRIKTATEEHPQFGLLGRRDYLFLFTMRSFLAVDNLTSLELDLCGSQLIPHSNQDHYDEPHICPDIAALLTTLRRARVRMRRICADVLKLEQHSASLRLNEVLVNLSLYEESPLSTCGALAIRCGSSPGCFLRLKGEMETEARALARQMADPKMVRVITHSVPKMETRAYDALTDGYIALNEGAEWDADGEAIPDEVPSEASEISDLSLDDDE